jgi:hypothetical protein
MKVIVGSNEVTHVTQAVVESLRSRGHAVSLVGPLAEEVLDAWFATAYCPNPDDDACLAEAERLEDEYRRGAQGRGRRRIPS